MSEKPYYVKKSIGDECGYPYHIRSRSTMFILAGADTEEEAQNICDNMNGKTEESILGRTEYEPEKWTVLKDDILALISALESANENTKELLLQHDHLLGRETRKHKSWAETLEGDIAAAGEALKNIHKWRNSVKPLNER